MLEAEAQVNEQVPGQVCGLAVEGDGLEVMCGKGQDVLFTTGDKEDIPANAELLPAKNVGLRPFAGK